MTARKSSGRMGQGLVPANTTIGFLLPPQRAVWVPAGISHRTWLDDVDGASVCFSPSFFQNAGKTIRVIAAPSLMREMILYALRWPPSREARDPVAETFFQTMVLLCKEWFKEEMPFSVPRSDNPAICRALEYIRDHLSYATIPGASEAAAVSERTLRRLFEQELRCTWRQYLHQSRMVKAMTLLERPGAQMANVTDEVGFESLSAFIKAFREFAGETPSQFQRRARPNSIAE